MLRESPLLTDVDSYLGGEDMLLTVGHDWTVAMWTVDGVKAGVFGQFNAWNVSDPTTFMESKAHTVPALKQDHKTPDPSKNVKLVQVFNQKYVQLNY